MKAKIKETGKLVTVGFYDVETLDFLDPGKLDFVPEFDWQAFRREAAKDILAGCSASCSKILIYETTSFAIQLADELIRQLKEK